MAPFTTPKVVISGLKERFDSLLIHADRLYLGSSTGSLHVYNLNEGVHDGERLVELAEVKKNLVRRSIEQLGIIKDVNSLVVLSEATVTLFPLPSISPPTPLIKAKAAFSFAIHSGLQYKQLDVNSQQSGESEFKKPQAIPTLVTQLLVGCRRKVVLYSWKDGEPQEVKEAPLPHSARVIVFLNKDTACFAYSPTEYAIFSILTMSAVEIVTPLPLTGSGTAMNALTGLTGYMSLGRGAKAKATVVQVADSEVLLGRDSEGLFIGTDGKQSRPAIIEWPVPPEDIAFVKPYIFSIFPAGTVPTQSSETSPATAAQVQHSFNSTAVVQVRSSLSLQISQTMPFPFNLTEPNAVQNANIRLMMPSTSTKCPLYMMTTPIDKAAALNEGSSIWCFSMRPWSEQIDELVIAGQYSDALALLDTVDGALLPDKDQKRIRIQALNAVAQFRATRFDAAIDTFIELDFNPAKVVALYPESVAGRLSIPQEGWIPLYGGPSPVEEDHVLSEVLQESDKAIISQEKPTTDLDLPSGTGSVGGRLRRTGLGMFVPSMNKDDDTASVKAKRKPLHDDLRRSVETLVRYLADRRPKLGAALEVVNISPASQSHLASPLSEASIDELFALPNVPLSALTPEQLLRFAQVVDTALYKSYLIIRPALLGSLCRVANWCEVSEVEEDLRARKKYAELRDLYHGKKMHAKALDLLKDLSENETDMEDKLDPSIRYLQKLGPEHIDQIFASSRWIFNLDPDRAFQIFTSEDVELPKQRVADYLETIDARLCARYLEYIINERDRDAPAVLHNRLAELYLTMVLGAKERNQEKARKEFYEKLLSFISLDKYFSIDRLYGLLSSTDLYEARAILLGRLGRHNQALETYVYRLHDYLKAEEHCKRVYRAGEEGTSGIFLALLKLYLRPTSQTSSDLLQPALELISRHGPRLDAVETLQLLPPLVTADDVRPFLIDALRTPVFDTRVVREISKARNDQLSRRLMVLQSRMVKVTDSRICPQCHRRLGNSVIAVHAPRGEVTHYQCREPFSRHLRDTRG